MSDDFDFDFGFTTASEEDFKKRENLVKEQVSTAANSKVDKLYKMIIPFLNNLAKDSDTREYIYWPNRKEKIEEFIAKLNSVVDS